jgi:hypothetical protein
MIFYEHHRLRPERRDNRVIHFDAGLPEPLPRV